MAKYTITHSCGHEQTHALYGRIKDRENKIAWLATQECTECWKKAQKEARAKNDAEREKNFKKLGIDNLPALRGTPKQIVWAEKIRKQLILSYAKCGISIVDDTKFVPLNDCIFIHITRLEKSAKWYIETFKDDAIDHTHCIFMLERHFAPYIAAIAPYIDDLPNDEKTDPIKKNFIAARSLNPKEFIPTWVFSGVFFALTRLAMHPSTSFQELTAVDESSKKEEWKQIAVNLQNIKTESDNAMLINLPHNSPYEGFSVWISKKLIREGSHSWERHIAVSSDMEFTLKKYGKGKWNKYTAIEEKKINIGTLAEAFGGYVEKS